MAKKDKPKGKKDPLAKFRNKLADAGLELSEDGTTIEGGEAGSFGTKEQLALIQQAYEEFGISSNPFYDPQRVAYDPSVKTERGSKAGRFIDLATGVYTSGQGVASDELLGLLRARTGYDIEYERQLRAKASSFERQTGIDEEGNPIYETYTPVAFRTAESFGTYAEAARKNYLSNFGAEGTGLAVEEPPAGAPTVDTAFNELADDDLFTISDTVSKLLESRRRKNLAQVAAGSYFGFGDLLGDVEE